MENKRDRFKRVAVTRTNKIITLIRLLGNCANKNNYDYTDKDIKKIFSTLESELKKTKGKFTGAGEENKKFTL